MSHSAEQTGIWAGWTAPRAFPWAPLVLGGFGLGVSARLVDFLFPKWIGNVAAVWFLAGFLAGRTARHRRMGVPAGVVCLLTATVAYYALRLAIDPISIDRLVGVPTLWLVAGVVSGAVSGRLGELSFLHPDAWGVPAGVFAGEAGVVMFLRHRTSQMVAELICAAVCLWMARTRWPKALALAAATVPFVAWLGGLYRIVLG